MTAIFLSRMALQGKLQLYRGTKANLANADASAEGMLAYVTDEQQVYVAIGTAVPISSSAVPAEGGTFVRVGASLATTSSPGIVQPDGSTILVNGNGVISVASPASVTSVGLSMPSIFSVSGSPVTNAGTFTVSLEPQSVNTFLGGPSTGTDPQTPTFRALVWNDLPIATSLTPGIVRPDGTTTTVNSSGVITAITGQSGFPNEPANTVFSGPSTGFAAQPTFRTLVSADMPAATSGLIGAVVPDGTTLTVVTGGVISAIPGSAAINQLTGDVLSGPGVGSQVATLATMPGLLSGSYTYPTLTVDAKGRINSIHSNSFSIGLSAPSEFSVSGSPITSSGTLTFTKNQQNPNTVWAGPTSGTQSIPAFRALVGADLPLATAINIGGVKPDGTTTTVDSNGVLSAISGAAGINQLTGDVLAGPGAGSQAATLATISGLTPGSYTTANITVDSKGRITAASSGIVGQGTVTSVDLTMPSEFTVGGTPITTSGTIAITKSPQSGNLVYASPNGSTGVPTFRGLVPNDLPVATSSALGVSRPDNSTLTVLGGVLSVASASLGITQLTGDVSAGPGSGSQTATLANTGAVAGTYNYATIQIDSKGRVITAVSNTVGTVTHVALAVPSEFTVSGSPITGSGTITISKSNQSANLVYAGPASGTAAVPGFRSLVSDDLPPATSTTIGGVVPDGTTTTVTTGGVISAIAGTAGMTQLTGDVSAGPGVGSQAATLSTTGVTAGTYKTATITVDAKGRITSASDTALIGFVVNSGAINGTAAWVLASKSSKSITKLKVVTIASDSVNPLTFNISQNGVNVMATNITVNVGTASGTVNTYTNLTSTPLVVAQDDLFILNITAGSNTWKASIQLE